ncbi:hypothetical protein GQ600_5731 [Phytophthora cactorum]|nr:hypothetical protein GQ600_5731 [Phytophthora cactorum]
MLPPPSLTVVQMLASEEATEEVRALAAPRTGAGSKSSITHHHRGQASRQRSHRRLVQAAPQSMAQAAGVGPKCVCQKRRAVTSRTTTSTKQLSNRPGLIDIPAEYVGCTAVTVSGKRVPFSRDMQQQSRKSWTPLDAIEEDE